MISQHLVTVRGISRRGTLFSIMDNHVIRYMVLHAISLLGVISAPLSLFQTHNRLSCCHWPNTTAPEEHNALVWDLNGLRQRKWQGRRGQFARTHTHLTSWNQIAETEEENYSLGMMWSGEGGFPFKILVEIWGKQLSCLFLNSPQFFKMDWNCSIQFSHFASRFWWCDFRSNVILEDFFRGGLRAVCLQESAHYSSQF